MFGVAIALTVLFIVMYRTADILLSHETWRPEIGADLKIQEFNTEFVRNVLERYSNSANKEETEFIIKYSDIMNYVHIAEELKPEIEQKYGVAIVSYFDGYHIKPNGAYESEYWS